MTSAAAHRRTARLLGWAGVPPFALLAALSITGGGELIAEHTLDLARRLFLVWSALVATFIGAVRWGAALATPTASSAEYAWGIVPSAVAAAALIVNPVPGLLLLMGLYVGLLVFDRLRPPPAMPGWYLPLRTALTATVLILHLPVLAALL